jgi:hypothetical protein
MKIYATGCSITAGAGFPRGKQDPAIYINLLAQKYSADVINDAEGGASNLKIFMRAAKAMIDSDADVFVVQWSAVHRHWMYPMPNQGVFVGTPMESSDHRKFTEQFQRLNHDYNNLMAVIDFTRILQDQAREKNKKMCFVNGLISWKRDLLERKQESDYAQSLFDGLTVQERDDFADRLANNMELVDWTQWVHPWITAYDFKIDDAPLDHHPGPRTHEKLAELIAQVIDKQQEVI